MRSVPLPLRWQVCQGVAHPFPDNSPWCRVVHAALCPASDASNTQLGRLRALRLHLAVRTRRLTDLGLFTPVEPEQAPSPTAPQLPLVLLLSVVYLAPAPVPEIRCIAQTRHRTRCTQSLACGDQAAEPASMPLPAAPDARHLRGDLTGAPMLVQDLTHLPYVEQLRWRQQHCPWHHHTLAPDVTLTEWQVFDAFAHHEHVRLLAEGEDPRGHG